MSYFINVFDFFILFFRWYLRNICPLFILFFDYYKNSFPVITLSVINRNIYLSIPYFLRIWKQPLHQNVFSSNPRIRLGSLALFLYCYKNFKMLLLTAKNHSLFLFQTYFHFHFSVKHMYHEYDNFKQVTSYSTSDISFHTIILLISKLRILFSTHK